MLAVVVGERHGVQGAGGPAPVAALLVVRAVAVHVLPQVVPLLVSVQVP